MKPDGQLTQLPEPDSLNVPLTHAVAADVVQLEPAGQIAHEGEPVVVVYVPV